jgi:tetratricopeptide (TPR) repeat protein
MQDKSRAHSFIVSSGWLLAVLAFVLRLAYILAAKSNPTFWAPAVDPLWYDEAAQAFANGSLGTLPFFRAPLYPAVLGGLYYLLGHDLVVARVLNAVVQSVAVWALFRVGWAYFSPLVAWVGAGLLALNGMAIYFSGEILTTSLELLASVCVLWATLRAIAKPSMATWIVCGLALGAATITRPNFLILVPLVLFFLLRKRSGGWRPRLLLWVVAIALPIMPVTLMNTIGSGEFVLVATQGGVNFWIGNNPTATGIYSSLPGIGTEWTMQDAEEIAAYEEGRQLRPGELSDFYYRKALRFTVAHPLAEARLLLRKALLFVNRFEVSNNKLLSYFIRLAPWLPLLCYLNFALLIPLSVVSLWVGRNREKTRLLLGLVLFYAVSVILFFVTSRFRMPVVPMLCLLAALAIEWFRQTVVSQRGLRSLAPLLLLVPAGIVTFMNPWNLREAPEGWAYFMEGNACMGLNEPEKAEVAFQRAVDDLLVLPLAHVNLGVLAFRRGNFEQAEKEYRLALADDSLCVKAWNNLGTIRESLGDTSGAISAYSRALAIRPYAKDARTNLAGLYFRKGTRALREGRDEEAPRDFRQSIELLPGRAASHYNLAVALGRLGEHAQALRALETALAIDPAFEPARLLMEKMRISP